MKKYSLEKVLEEYKDMVRAKASNLFILGAEKDDLIQEGMIGLVKACESYDESKGASFDTYADICVTRQMLTAIKLAGRQKNAALNMSVSIDTPLSDEEGAPTLGESLVGSPDADPAYQLLYKELLEIIVSPGNEYFSALEHQVLILLLSGFNYKEIAERLGKTPKQIDNTMQRIKKKLKTFLE